jgi:prophage regulatory protein
MDTTPTPRILRRPQVTAKIGLERTAIYDRLDPKSPSYDPTFPRPIRLGNGPKASVGWLEDEVDRWVLARIAETRNHAFGMGATRSRESVGA